MSITGRDPDAARRLVEQWVPAEIRALHRYAVPDAEGLIKLDAMENPYPWPEPMVADWLERLRSVAVNRYPDPRAPRLRSRLRAVMDVPDEAEVVLGNGSDELIQLAILTVGGPDSVVLAPVPTFPVYELAARAYGRRFVGVDLRTPEFALDTDAVLEAMARHRPGVVFLAYPNNPTGNLFDRAAVERILAAAPGLVVIDEAYAPFAKASFMGKVCHYPNLVVLRTVSKIGLAGLRLGLLAGAPEWVAELDKVRMPYNINVLTQASAEFALAHHEVFVEQTERLCAARDEIYRRLVGLNRITVWPSAGNFLLVRVPAGTSTRVMAGLRERGVLVRNFDGSSALLADCIRISIGTSQENEVLLHALTEVLREG